MIRTQTSIKGKFLIDDEIGKAAGHGSISPQDWQAIRYFWHKFDPESNGTIIVHEIDDLIIEMGYKMTMEQRKTVESLARQRKLVNIPFLDCLGIINEYKAMIKEEADNQYRSTLTSEHLDCTGR